MRLRNKIVVATGALALLAGGTAYAAIPDSDDGEFHACVSNTGSLKTIVMIDKQAGTNCPSNYTEKVWNQQGPAGPQGPQGEPGEQGSDGAGRSDIYTADQPFSSSLLNGQNDANIGVDFNDSEEYVSDYGNVVPSGYHIEPVGHLFDAGFHGNSNGNPYDLAQVYPSDLNRTLNFQFAVDPEKFANVSAHTLEIFYSFALVEN